jgi:four helix bundle protein
VTEKAKKVMGFEDLLVWQKGLEIVKQFYLISKEGELCRDFALRDQLRRAAISILTNFAEGYKRTSRKEYINFLNYAKGSTGEVRSLLSVAVPLLSQSDKIIEGVQLMRALPMPTTWFSSPFRLFAFSPFRPSPSPKYVCEAQPS